MYNSKNSKRMSAMSLEAEKNELIRRILDVDDVAILRRVKSMLSCEEEQTNVVAEEAAPYQTKAEILASLDQAFKELKLNLEGKLEFKSLDDALNEI
jgi:predicted phage gp36 major capsid-like protein